MANIIGRFYFKRSVSGNLIGEYSNNDMQVVTTESADVLEPTKNFVGNYDTSWREGGSVMSATLSITERVAGKIFSLVWTKETDMYWGEGMLLDNDTMIGDYRNFNPIP